MKRILMRSSALASLVLIAQPAIAQSLKHADICDPATNTVIPEKLALTVLSLEGVSFFPYAWITSNSQISQSLSPAKYILVKQDYCQSEKGSDQLLKCAKEDGDKIEQARIAVEDLLQGNDARYRPSRPFNPRSPTTVIDYFVHKNVELSCMIGADSKPIEKPGKIKSPFKFGNDFALRVRGSTDGLQFDREEAAFKGLEKASISFKDDDEEGEKTTKANFVVAYAINLSDDNNDRLTSSFVPYFGVTLDKKKEDGEPEKTNSNIFRFGGMLDYRLGEKEGKISHLLGLRQEYLFEREEKSELFTTTMSYTPLINGVLNSGMNITNDKNQSLFTIIPRLQLRANYGNFTKLGTRDPLESKDFIRLGGQIGMTIASDLDWLPFELTVTETYLRGIKSTPRNLSQLKGELSFYFDKNKYYGIDLGYVRGRNEDLSERERNWTLGFGAKF